ncbi:hypothetical protein MYCGRDRAFT_106752 [Lecanosticta acicola]|uniref:C2H2-type domain-containing protein n=1 Tax=Lecanosticta acicola TaxID=111012 RepID=A0AAI8YYW7_9PEZI|nr:hypothetical protein MYCGRDRAFT_106752 [Lecanosticta acicola]
MEETLDPQQTFNIKAYSSSSSYAGALADSTSEGTSGTPPQAGAARHDSFSNSNTNIKAGQQQFHCTKCNLSFTEKRALLRHERESEKHNASDTAPRLNRCTECGKSYKRAHDLRRHVDEVHRAKRRKRGPGGDDSTTPEEGSEDANANMMVPPPGAIPFGGQGTTDEPMVVGIGQDGAVRQQTYFVVPKTDHMDSLTLLRQSNRPARKASHLDLARDLLAQNTRFSKDQEAISLNPETRLWLENWMKEFSVFSVSAFNDRDFAFKSEKYTSIVPTLAPDLKFSHHKIPTAFNHTHMIVAYNQMSALNPNWNIKVLGAAPFVSLKDKTATIFVQSLVTDDGNVWAEQIIEYKWQLYSSRWLCKHVTSMRGQRLLGA